MSHGIPRKLRSRVIVLERTFLKLLVYFSHPFTGELYIRNLDPDILNLVMGDGFIIRMHVQNRFTIS